MSCLLFHSGFIYVYIELLIVKHMKKFEDLIDSKDDEVGEPTERFHVSSSFAFSGLSSDEEHEAGSLCHCTF